MFKILNNCKIILEKQKNNGMRTEGLIYASPSMLEQILNDGTLKQVANVATLPGIVGKSLAMPDCHQGYGFCIGGVAAFDKNEGIMSCGGVGFDINCGVRLLKSNLCYDDIKDNLKAVLAQIFRDIPTGTGTKQQKEISRKELDHYLNFGVKFAYERGFASKEDMENCESFGYLREANSEKVSEKAKIRGSGQIGTLGSGNHFIELQVIDEIFDEDTANVFGLYKNQVVIMIHTGSRGLGHQVCSDYLKTFQKAMPKYNISVPDLQLACVPFNSSEGQNYFAAMCASANFAFVNRQIITHITRNACNKALKTDIKLDLLYDVAHNIAKLEKHIVNDKEQDLIVYRKGATRAFPKGHKELSNKYQQTGQPVLIPGSMGTSSYILVGENKAMEESFASVCHGAGRLMSRSKAKRETNFAEIRSELKEKNIIFQVGSKAGLVEEAPRAYKDIEEVVKVVRDAGLARYVAKAIPIAVIKG